MGEAITTAGPAEAAHPRPAAWAPRPSVLRTLLPALAAGALLWACHFPLAWGGLGWVALVPLLALVRSTARPRTVYLSAYAGAVLFYVPVLQWMRVADPAMYVTWIALALYCAAFVPLGLWLVRLLDRRTPLPLVLSLPLVWTALEFFRAHFLGGFGWYLLGYTQATLLPVVQVADLGGIWAVTCLVAAANAVLFEWLYRWPPFRRLLGLTEPQRSRIPALLIQTAAVLLLVGADLGYGYWRLGQDTFEPGPRIALIQGNVPQRVRNESSRPGDKDAGEEMLDHYALLSDLAVREQPRPDLLVWPETCFPGYWYEIGPGVPAERVTAQWRSWVAESVEVAGRATHRWPTNLLLGLDSEALQPDGRSWRYNSALLILQDGRVAGEYSKMHLVPFGEYVPLRDWIPWMNLLSPYDFDYSVTPGERQTRFEMGKFHFGTLICYEDSDTDLARQYVRPGGGPLPDFLVNISNDGWFDGTSEHEEHLAVARLRAVECRRSLLRAVNMGISAVIDGNGRVLAPEATGQYRKASLWQVAGDGTRAVELPPSRWHEFKKVAGVVTALVPIDHRSSVYAVWGDWLPWTCWVMLGGALLWAVAGRFRRAGDAAGT